MNEISFYKMSGAGNDFIVIDNRQGIVAVKDMPAFAAKVCRRRMSVGADGIFFLENSEKADFKWHFFNSDGSSPGMCGNGARCAARYAFLNGITSERLCFETLAGIIQAHVQGDRVSIWTTPPRNLELNRKLNLSGQAFTFGSVDTGVPHVVIETQSVDDLDVVTLGKQIRHHPDFAPEGTNVNFIARLGLSLYAIRTYERGVEDETLACGTGNVAAAIVTAAQHGLPSPITLRTRSATLLNVHFARNGMQLDDVRLEGDARVIYTGRIQKDAWAY